MGYYYILYDYVLQLLEMEKKKIVVLLGSLWLQVLLALLQLYGRLREN